MKMKNLIMGGAFLGVFTLGAMFAPIGESTATNNSPSDNGKLSAVPVVNEKDAPQGDSSEYTCPMTGEPMGSGAGMGMHMNGSMFEVVAESLGMSVDELQAAQNQGKSVAAIAKEKGVTVEALTTKVFEARKAALEQLVKDGKLSQQQMDTMLDHMEAQIKSMIENDSFGAMMNGSKGMRGMMGKGRWNNSAETTQQLD